MTIAKAFPLSRRTLLAGSGAFLLGVSGVRAAGPEVIVRSDLDPEFASQKVNGTFALFQPAQERLTLVNPVRAEQRFVPASTFKVPNSLIALETGAVRNADEVIPYGGRKQPFPAWEKDMPMREAITASAVPIYQELARRIDFDNYRIWLEKLDYGNQRLGTNLENFWLDGPLEISSVEQTRFLARLARGELPASERAQTIVREILRLEERNGAILYGKTGWQFSSKPQRGWWAGWVDRGGQVASFCLNMDMTHAVDAGKRLAIGRRMLERLQVY